MAYHTCRDREAFSLVEVVIAIAVCSFALIAILGLFATGMQSTRESEGQIQAANFATTLVSMRLASPTNDLPNLSSFAIPTTAMTNAYGPAYGVGKSTNYIAADGQTTTVAANAVYTITCLAGTNTAWGSGVAQVYLMLTWPPQASPTSAVAGRYELVTAIPIR